MDEELREREPLEKFVRYSIFYQIQLAKHVSLSKNTRVYVFDSFNFFDKDTCSVEVLDTVTTLVKQDKRAVLSVAVRLAFETNSELFREFADNVDLQEDDIGLYVLPPMLSPLSSPIES